jgi:Asp-tRNA(Asn)/Glu-tRNA(Gln) amidotransferase A subunit family amidase
MRDLTTLSLRALAGAVARRECSVEAVASAYAERITVREAEVQAWQHFDAGLVREQARALDRAGAVSGLEPAVP